MALPLYLFAGTFKVCQGRGKVCRGKGFGTVKTRAEGVQPRARRLPLHGRDKPQACVLYKASFSYQ